MKPMEVDMRRKEEEEDVDSFNAYDLEKEQHKHPLLVNSFIAVFLALSLWHATSLTLPEDQPTPLASSSSASASASASSSWSSWSSPSSSSSWSHSLATRPCTFAECEGGGCDEATAPYLCVDQTTPGAPYSGCSAIPWDPHATLCKASCDMVLCQDSVPIVEEPTCQDKACSADWCAGQQLCDGASVPFQCVEGAARFGCSADEYGWELVDDSTCGECCDVRTCP